MRYPTVDGVCDEWNLELGEDKVTRMTVVNFLKNIGSKPITYDNTLPLRKRLLLPER